MTITKLSETSSDQVRKLLEACGVNIRKDTAGRFDIECPSCQKSEAFIEYKHDKRWIKCNRDNNCGYNQGLWQLIAEKQGISPTDKFKMLEYINITLGLEFVKKDKQEVITHNVKNSHRPNQKFLNDCNQIFKNAFNQKNPEVKVSWDYLYNRGYSEEKIKSFNLGYLLNENELFKSLTSSLYNYKKDEAKKLMNDSFSGALNSNKNTKDESKRSRIVFTWYDRSNNVSGFTFRVSTNEKVDAKYLNNNNFKKNQSLFNANNYQAAGNQNQIVIVEGSLDALSASHLSPKDVQDNYHFVAMGGNSFSEEQAILLKSRGVSQAILLIDNDEAGDNKYESNIKQLLDCNITASIARIPSKYEHIKDVDELLRKHPEDKNILMQILSDAEKKITQ